MTAMTPPNPEYDLLTADAYRRYRAALNETQRRDLDLYEQLSTRLPTLRVLYLAYLDLDTALLDEDSALDRADAQGEGLVFITGHRVRLTRDGLVMLWDWKNAIAPHLRKPAFQALWKRVHGW